MTREPIEVTRQDRIYCLKVSSDYHSEVCEECRFYPNCDHMTQDDMTELTIKDLETLEQEPCEDVISKKANNLCNSCTNVRCEFQSGIVRTECAFYMPPHMQPDSCGNYVIQESTKNDLGVDWDELKRKILMEVDGGTDDKWLSYSDVCDNISNSIDDFKADLPSVTPQEPRWIPVSERLPEDIKPVIVTWKNTSPESYYQYIVGKHFIGTAHYKNGKWFWYSSVTEDFLAEYGRCDSEEFDEAIEVVAWQKLPEPYKAESEE